MATHFREMPALQKRFLITFARNRTFSSIFTSSLAENLLTNTDPWPETTQNCGTSKPTSPLCFYGLGHVTRGRKRFAVCFPSHSGREEFSSSKWLPDAQKEVFGTLQGHRWFSALMATISSSPSHTLAHYADMLISLHKLSMQLNHVMSAETLAVLSRHDRPALD